jgi:acyl transferase domain-containing protein
VANEQRVDAREKEYENAIEEPALKAFARQPLHLQAARIAATPGTDVSVSVDSILLKVVEVIKEVTHSSAECKIDIDQPLLEMGIGSADVLELTGTFRNAFGVSVSALFFFENITCREIADAMVEIISSDSARSEVSGADSPATPGRAEPGAGKSSHIPSPNSLSSRDIAVIGIACRLPNGIDSHEAFWKALIEERDVVSVLPAGRWQWPPDIDPCGRHCGIDRGAYLQDVARFDAEFFRILPNEAEIMDPQQRILLELGWQCLEDAGYASSTLAGSRTGVFVGASGSDYRTLLNRLGVEMDGHAVLATAMSLLPNRLSYFYDFHGPSIHIDTACSSSLVAVYEAMQALRSGVCDQALVAGINIMCDPALAVDYYRAGMLSKDGMCKTFDAAANGYVRAEGAVVFLLKPARSAQRDGDFIYGLLKGCAINHGGRSAGVTVPNARAQSELLRCAYEDAGVPMASVEYLETHGTGTPLGDPIEVQAIKMAKAASAADAKESVRCGIGSLKTNLGHMEAASGIAGALKALLAVKNQMIPASLNFTRLNPEIDLTGTGLYVAATTAPWPDSGNQPCRVGVSNFGSGGTNAHLVIEEYLGTDSDAVPSSCQTSESPQLVVLSAKTEQALKMYAAAWVSFLDRHPVTDKEFIAIARTLQTGREAMSCRIAFVANSAEDMRNSFSDYAGGKWNSAPGTGRFEGNNNASTHHANGGKAGHALAEAIAESMRSYQQNGECNDLLQLWANGAPLDWVKMQAICGAPSRPACRQTGLPTYPFQGQSYWIKTPDRTLGATYSDDSSRTERENLRDAGAPEGMARSYAAVTDDLLVTRVLHNLIGVFSSVTKLDREAIDPDQSFDEYGIDSITVVQLNDKLSLAFPNLSKAVFYEYSNLRQLSGSLLEQFQGECVTWTGLEAAKRALLTQVTGPGVGGIQPGIQVPESSRRHSNGQDRRIAIIGLAGRYPGAATLGEFYNNLRDGKDCITEIPEDRWSLEGFYEPDVEAAIREGKSFGKWGGFITDCTGFDPGFFHISPHEAITMDPQERVFLETCCTALEDAGYSRESIARLYQGQVGVFVGITKTGYELYTPELQTAKRYLPLRTSFSSVANRVSYLLDLHGPSMPIDTMCAASLTAIHEACEHLIRGECAMAIAGGVNLYLHPSSYVYLASQRMLSTHGKCESFGAGGNGFVPGEGVGAALLKPLADAVQDRDHIYGIIRATSINHCGKTNGYTVPNPAAQRDLIKAALHSGDVHPGEVSYIEAHGTGTALGDPVEIDGLTQAFAGRSIDDLPCAIGSVKSNIGHLESAAGIAGLTKVLLQMQHQVLFPSLHSAELNPYIDFGRTSFRVQRHAETWRRPTVASTEGTKKQVPLMAGISAFGAGGANAHMIVEEYTEKTGGEIGESICLSPRMIVLSAKNEERLREKARELESFLAASKFSDGAIKHIAYTLQVGRDAMESRLAFTAETIDELCIKLSAYAAGKAESGEIENFYRGDVRHNHGTAALFTSDEDLQTAMESWVAKGKYGKLLEAWVRGISFNWSKLYRGEQDVCRRISLPTYPFAHEQYWPDMGCEEASDNVSRAMHPLLHRNTSTLVEQRFTSRFTGSEFYLKDHVIAGRKVLPAVCYLEMARAALLASLDADDETPVELSDIVWMQPIEVDSTTEVNIALSAGDGTEVEFEVYKGNHGDEVIHARGRSLIQTSADAGVTARAIDLAALKAGCEKQIAAPQCYEIFASMGIHYGSSHRGLQNLWIGNQGDQAYVLAHVALPEALRAGAHKFRLHPSIADSALQASLGFRLTETSPIVSRPFIPFALKSIRIMRTIPQSCWVFARSGETKFAETSQRLDLQICDDAGQICAILQGLSLRATRESERSEASDPYGPLPAHLLLMEQRWEAKPLATVSVSDDSVYGDRWGFLSPGFGASLNELKIHCSEVKWSVLPEMDNAEELLAPALVEAGKQVLDCIQSVLKGRPQKPVLFQVLTSGTAPAAFLVALSGMFKTASRENPKLRGQVIMVPPEASIARLALACRENASCAKDDREIRYLSECREVAGLREVMLGSFDRSNAVSPWRDEGVYLLTGGAGSLGMIFAAEIVRCAIAPHLILLGRSDLDETASRRLETLAPAGSDARIEYRRCDVTDRRALTECIEAVIRDHDHLTGVLHCAGVLRDGFIIKKNLDDLQIVAAPKIAGALNLDYATRNLDLDLFVLFSSVAGAIGNVGQCDYAFANAFLDQFASHRNALVKLQQRRGQALAIGWPLWAEGGMKVDDATYAVMRRQGMERLASEDGLKAFYAVWQNGNSRSLLLAGEKLSLAQYAGISLQPADDRSLKCSSLLTVENEVGSMTDSLEPGLLRKKVRDVVIEEIGAQLRLQLSDVDVEAEFSDLGFDSISLSSLSARLHEACGVTVSPAIFFEHTTVLAFVEYLLTEHGGVLKSRLTPSTFKPSPITVPASADMRGHDGTTRAFGRQIAMRRAPREVERPAGEPIAIVGVSGYLPGANDLDTFWQNLEQGTESIREIPPDRWDWRAIYGDPFQGPNRTNIKWGGFIDSISRFDPLFFGISPQEAELMDPSQRLLMTCGWMAMEDAGYSAQSLSGSRAGIFVGVTNTGYTEMIVASNIPSEAYTSTGRVASVGPNRLSYWLNWHGPSEPIETACSSSLVAIHRAVQSIRSSECEMALAGGVNAILLPWIQISFNKAGMLSKDGHCKTFSSDANGYVRGEGAGMVFLKKLSAAKRDGDHIYAVVLGTAENHGGRANSLTAPNPKAQAEVIKAAFHAAGIHPGRVTYIEAHGTGTPLGDPVEINGLKNAFAEMSREMPPASVDLAPAQCGLGSVKTNIGHLEVAAGIAGVIKVLLQMKHRKLVKSLHCEQINPYIQLENSPFYIVQQAQPWPAKCDAQGRELPRVAGVSSFGFGGVNAHVVLEEYVEDQSAECDPPQSDILPSLIVLSARNRERLRGQVVCLRDHLARHPYSDVDLKHIAYTLQVGRDCWTSRLAFSAASIGELKTKLSAFPDGAGDGLICGEVKRRKDATLAETSGEALQVAIDKAIGGECAPLLNLWTSGASVDWSRLYVGRIGKCRRMSLPAYSFARETHWLDEGSGVVTHRESVAATHPLLEKNTSSLDELRFTTAFTGMEFFLADHVVQGKKVLPGVCYLEMARAAFTASSKGNHGTGIEIKDVVWLQPIDVAGSREVHIGLDKGDGGDVFFRVYTNGDDGQKLVHAQGRIAPLGENASSASEAQFDLASLETAYRQYFDREKCYATFEAIGLHYGPSHRGLSSLRTGEDSAGRYVLGTLELPGTLSGTRHQFELHPSIADSALQATVGFMLVDEAAGARQPSIPFALDRLRLFRKLPDHCRVYVRECSVQHGTQKLDLHLCNDSGQVCASFIGLSLRMARPSSSPQKSMSSDKSADAGLRSMPPATDFAFGTAPATMRQITITAAPTENDLKQIIERELVDGISKQLKIKASEIDVEAELSEFGIDSIGLTTLSTRLNQEYKIATSPALFFEYTTIRAFAGYLLNEYPTKFQIELPAAAHAIAEVRSPAVHAPMVAPPPVPLAEAGAEELQTKVERLLVHEISRQLKINVQDIDVEAELSEFGLDSIGLTALSSHLRKACGIDVSPPVFFEYTTVIDFTGYLLREHLDAIHRYFLNAPASAPAIVNTPAPETAPRASLQSPSSQARRLQNRTTSARNAGAVHPPEPVAIVGMSGRFPGANTLEDFWENLKWGTDSIQEIPPQRWDWRAIYGDPQTEFERTLAKWGGFIDGVDEFDPLFFGISPKEAAAMDPRQRLFMTYGWKAIEDAGYSAQTLSGSKTGIFAGTSASDFIELLTRANAAPEGFSPIGVVASLVPNRLSNWLNWHGPSEPIETACSSSLVAIHRAVRAIQGGECDMALAGGVNTIITPWLQIAFSKAGMLSKDGRCKTFSKDANGYVRGEGVGVLFLKPVSAAKRDGDHIYGIITGSAVNHGGHATSLTSPNPKLQADVVKAAYSIAGIDPRTVTYIEAHGTGTPLGDPIEINGLKSAFADLFEEFGLSRSNLPAGYCGIGSVKTNVGHLELAAGVVGVIKVLLQLKHKTLARSLHCQEQNPYIQLENSPFFFVQQTQPWLARTDAEGREIPRVAGVSSFGFGGVNAHVVIEEYSDEATGHEPSNGSRYVMVLSAKTANRLREQAQQLQEHIAHGSYSDTDLRDIAYTLQVGRDAMDSRIAFTAGSIHETQEKLSAYLAAKDTVEGIEEFHCGQLRRDIGNSLRAEEDMQLELKDQAAVGTYGELLELWVQGLSFEWKKLYADQANKPRRLSLPTYPFLREKYWVETRPLALGNNGSLPALHPLLHRNTSTLLEQRFSTTLKDEDVHVKDHVVAGRKLLPAVCCLEMACAAMVASSDPLDGSKTELKDILWLQPVEVNGEKVLHIRLGGAEVGDIGFEIYAGSGDEEIIYAQGRAANLADGNGPDNLGVLDLPALKADCVLTFESAECYEKFKTAGIEYGPAYRGLDSISRGMDGNSSPFVLAGIHLPESSLSCDSQYILHPSIVDSALQAALGLMPPDVDGSPVQLFVPFALDSIQICDRLPERCWAYATPVASNADPTVRKFNLKIADESGRVCVSVRGFSLRELSQTATPTTLEKILPVDALESPGKKANIARPEDGFLRVGAIAALKRVMSAAIDLSPEQLDENEQLEKYGIDSIFVLKLRNELAGIFPGISSTVFFDHRTLASLAGYLVQQRTSDVRRWLGLDGESEKPASESQAHFARAGNLPASRKLPSSRAFSGRFGFGNGASRQQQEVQVAIVGLAGRYPQAANIDEFWNNLKNGRNCITEIPPERWDWRHYYEKEKGVAGRMYSRWGGFLDGIDKFDPLFFRLSPTEAERMDPQERLFLQEAYACIEDAGYTARNICANRKVGVYVGVMNGTYAPNVTQWSIANRVSYLFDFQGPSMAVDTACSSSLTALHLAVEAIRNGECEVAVAGGVSLIIDPIQFLNLSEMTMLSSGNRCRAFGADADGFVDGEGVGAVLLKPLQRAITDGDHIYCVIKATVINAGGKTNGYTVPNPAAQSEVIREAIRRAGVDPRAIGYIEAHGTGTELGDPIEVEGLCRAFVQSPALTSSQSTGTEHCCAIGSVKSNIGHLESAAGIAGLTKVLMQMKHQTLAPSLHAEALNPHIDFGSIPFRVQQSVGEWKRCVIEIDGRLSEAPLLAGISSFGAGGANAHVIVEEYRMAQPAESRTEAAFAPERPTIVVLSARTQEQLRKQVHLLHEWLIARPFTDADLACLAFTLQVGREAMEHRLAFTVTSLQQLESKLSACLQGNLEKLRIDGCYYGELKRNGETASVFAADEDLETVIENWLEKGKYGKCLEYWVRGLPLDWSGLYRHSEIRPRRLSLPSYPFAQERYWMRQNAVATVPVHLPRQAPIDSRALDDVLDQVLTGELEISQAAQRTEEVLLEMIP